ncbi:uncharacterized protein LOC119724289 isoform X3 [Patiria miniata]|uniref:TIR domain-containing protein n=1 Tax=Patiria miniata TaxID=46514 RepID=A0A913ZIJ5_PATMI|nr:uncharacterized protein LOC119724289 isoform X1 [Patiria miniata]XP_038051200.1 uncharacterized protein LOC119724289 isoform X2 [Patiria miniata]XP_038051201.1 uncharacterized protein LOC119724289 isoform X3 [Patiria miniata]
MGCGTSSTPSRSELHGRSVEEGPAIPRRRPKQTNVETVIVGPPTESSGFHAPEVDETDHGPIVRRCIEFLKVATSTGGQTARRSPLDPEGLQQTAGQRKALYPEFVASLERLHVTQSYIDDSSMESLLTVCRMSDLTDTELANELVEKRYPELFVKIWNAVYDKDIYLSPGLTREYIAFNLLKQATISFTHVSWNLCVEMGSAKHGIVPLIAKEFDHPLMTQEGLRSGVKRALWNSPRETLKKMINILANIIRKNIDNKPVFREAQIVPHLQELLKCRFMIMRAKALFCLVYLINEDENEALNTADDNINFVLKVLGKCLDQRGHYSDHYTFSAEVVVNGIVHMAVNDSNKVKLVKNGVLPKLITMLKTDNIAEKRAAAKAVWKLAFHEDNKKEFKTNHTLISVLKELQSSETEHKILKACSAVLWMLDATGGDGVEKGQHETVEKPPTLPGGKDNGEMEVQSVDGDGFDDDKPHVMISYQWGCQMQMIKVKELLRAAGYHVWMDVDNMGGSTLESMATAVERSAVVLVCFSEKYKRSASCRTEAEYTYKLQKPIIPLRLQLDYDPDGWLGIMIGAKLYVDMSRPDNLEEDFSKLKQQLGERGRVAKEGFGTLRSTIKSTRKERKENIDGSGGQGTDFNRSTTQRRSMNAKNTGTQENVCAKAVSAWTNDQVNAWLTKHGLVGLKNRFDGYSGQRLLGLKTISAEAPDFFYSELKKDLGFKSLLEIVTFKQALDGII